MPIWKRRDSLIRIKNSEWYGLVLILIDIFIERIVDSLAIISNNAERSQNIVWPVSPNGSVLQNQDMNIDPSDWFYSNFSSHPCTHSCVCVCVCIWFCTALLYTWICVSTTTVKILSMMILFLQEFLVLFFYNHTHLLRTSLPLVPFLTPSRH